MSGKFRLNLALLILYVLLTFAVLLAALAIPSFRPIAYAPLRALLEPAPEPIVVEVLYSTEKEDWLEQILDDFEATNPNVDGRPIELELKAMGSREMYLSVLDGSEQPDVISPASSLQISLLEELSRARFGESVVFESDTEQCRSVVQSPVVLVGWEDRAEALWGADPGDDLWETLQSAMTDPNGWAAYGHPEWGFVKFSHTNPLSSNSGFQTILLLTYDYHDKITDLTTDDILSDPDYQAWFTELEGSISDFGNSTGSYMEEIIAFGPSLYDFVVVYEATAIGQAENAANRYGALRIYYPPATSISDHPFCVLDADWVDPVAADAGQVFIDFLLTPEAQEAALLDHGFRPADASIPLEQAGSPFVTYRANGIQTELPPVVETPPGNVLNTLIDFWQRSN